MNISTGLKQKEKLLKQIESLETNNTYLKQQMETLETNARQKQAKKHSLLAQLNDIKAQSSEPAAEKNDLENSILFLTSEKQQLTREYQSVKSSLDNNLLAIDSMLKDLGFIKGEIATLIDQVSMLEEELPVRIRDADNLEDKISRSCANAITRLYQDMKAIENKAKVSYYKSYKEWDDIRSARNE
ncbi:MAG: hypothetical protein OMM_15417 [Candidatus Magnetoglobus multicellularis str. Araruama]|uniref:Magnetosome protein Mad24 n=2 Tax=Candidatus Magnetoglobus multicellularis TaxID=418099 RepID=F4ZYT5_9BACT|nr:hypothetical protein OMM_6 [Candidatus Magnetoglobus multicellularis]ETR64730.1 MAG: hypothetical protein OMM_15417 [Candidatus Magnetoglobus multicellularis str. Araruama]